MDHANVKRNGPIVLPLERDQRDLAQMVKDEETLAFAAQNEWIRSFVPSVPVQLFLVYLGILSLHALFALKTSDLIVILYAQVLTLLPRWAFKRFQMDVPVLFECTVALIVMGTLIFGEILHFYDQVWWWDIPLHALAGSIIAYVAYVLQREFFLLRHHRKYSRMLAIVFATLVSLGVSGAWEVYEFMVDQMFATSMQPNSVDTMIDLIAGLFGAALGSALLIRQRDFI